MTASRLLGSRCSVPSDDDRRRISEIIYDELCLDVVRDESRAFYLEAVDRLIAVWG